MENLDVIPRPDWEKYCSQVAARVLGEQSPERLLEVRGMLYELLVHCIPANTILSVSHHHLKPLFTKPALKYVYLCRPWRNA
jgi:hypothetical protein